MKVCYFSSGQTGKDMFQYLKSLDCEISFHNLENERIIDFESIDYEVGISFLYTYKIPESEFNKNKIWINFHPGPLPEYRGRNLCFHAINEGAKQFGATIHFMDKNFDTGRIIEVIRFPVEDSHTAGDLSLKARNALMDLFKQYIPLILKGENIDSYEQEQDGSYYKQTRIDEEIKLTADQELKVRALTVSPRFYAYTYIGNKKYILLPEEDFLESGSAENI